MDFLSTEYLTAAAAALNADPGYRAKISTATVTFHNVVENCPGGHRLEYSLRFTDGQVAMVPGPADNPQVTMTQNYDTHRQIVLGTLDGARAAMTGQLRISGDMTKVIQHQALLGGMAGPLAAVHAATEF